MQHIRKRAVTLIELLIVMALIVMISSVVGVNIRALLHEQRFRSESALVLDTLRLAQELMLIANSDARVVFNKDLRSGEISYHIELEKPLTKGWTREITRKRPPLTAVRWIEFQDAQTGAKTLGNVNLHFLSGGSVMSAGTLRLANADRNATLQSLICLPGYPAPLGTAIGCESNQKVREMGERLTMSTQRIIQEKDQAKTP